MYLLCLSPLSVLLSHSSLTDFANDMQEQEARLEHMRKQAASGSLADGGPLPIELTAFGEDAAICRAKEGSMC